MVGIQALDGDLKVISNPLILRSVKTISREGSRILIFEMYYPISWVLSPFEKCLFILSHWLAATAAAPAATKKLLFFA